MKPKAPYVSPYGGITRSPLDAARYAQHVHLQQHHRGVFQVDEGCPTCMALHGAVQACAPLDPDAVPPRRPRHAA